MGHWPESSKGKSNGIVLAVWQQDFLKLDLPDNHFDGVFANAALFHAPSQELPRSVN
jgi:hypothetical protein